MQVIFQPGIIGNRDGMRAGKLTGAADNFDPGGGKGPFTTSVRTADPPRALRSMIVTSAFDDAATSAAS